MPQPYHLCQATKGFRIRRVSHVTVVGGSIPKNFQATVGIELLSHTHFFHPRAYSYASDSALDRALLFT